MFSQKTNPMLRTLIRDGYLVCPSCATRSAGDMVAEKNCLHFWGQLATQVAKYVAEPILAPESRFRGIRWGNLHHFSRSIRSDRSRGSGEGSEMKIFPWCLKSSQRGQKCCGADFGSRIKISGHPLGRSAWFFEIYLVGAARIPKIRERKKSCVSSPAYSLRAPLWQTPISPTKGWAPYYSDLIPTMIPT